MHPLSHTQLMIIHNQKVEEMMENRGRGSQKRHEFLRSSIRICGMLLIVVGIKMQHLGKPLLVKFSDDVSV